MLKIYSQNVVDGCIYKSSQFGIRLHASVVSVHLVCLFW